MTIEALIAAGVLSKPRDGVKILGKGELKAKLTFEVAAASKSAQAAIEKAGGSVTLLVAPRPRPRPPEPIKRACIRPRRRSNAAERREKLASFAPS